MFVLCCAVKRVKLSGGGITLHLAIPIVVLKRMQHCLQFAPFLRRELINRSHDFSNRTHIEKLSAT